MQSLKAWLILALALSWAPISAHCELEAVPGFEFLRCLSEDSSSGEPDSHCAKGDCCSWESSQYHSIQEPLIAFPVLAEVVPVALVAEINFCLPPEVDGGWLAAAPPPPELSRTWQFSSRAALPVRAPSFVS